MKQKVLAIGIPSYNGEPYLDRCIPTFIDKELEGKIEVFIVNDGSTDRTREIAEKYAEKYPKIIKVINKENGGHGSAVNAALYASNAKYYKVVDCDDWVDTKELIELVKFLETTDADIISNAYNQVNLITGHSELINNYNVQYGKKYKLEELDIEEIYLSIHSTTYKADLLKKHNIKLQEKTFYVDVEYQLLPMPYVKSIVFLNNCVYKYMVGNANQSVNIDNFVKRYDDHDRVVKRIIEFLKDAKLTETQDKYIYSIMEKVIYTHYALSSIYDTDTNRGRTRSIEFDKYLRTHNKRLYDFVGKKYANINKLRRTDFKNKDTKIRDFLRAIKRIMKG